MASMVFSRGRDPDLRQTSVLDEGNTTEGLAKNNSVHTHQINIFSLRRPGFDHMRFVMEKIEIGFSEYLGFLCQFSFHKLLHAHQSSYHRRYVVLILKTLLNNQPKNNILEDLIA